ncbi:hypothetical protein BJ165DRAFT_1531272 [Panaeolus papilionaceus]|nr:hypothetical protein BJ165DRAFT_1531272 [Panaeolus papilionaceus]
MPKAPSSTVSSIPPSISVTSGHRPTAAVGIAIYKNLPEPLQQIKGGSQHETLKTSLGAISYWTAMLLVITVYSSAEFNYAGEDRLCDIVYELIRLVVHFLGINYNGREDDAEVNSKWPITSVFLAIDWVPVHESIPRNVVMSVLRRFQKHFHDINQEAYKFLETHYLPAKTALHTPEQLGRIISRYTALSSTDASVYGPSPVVNPIRIENHAPIQHDPKRLRPSEGSDVADVGPRKIFLWFAGFAVQHLTVFQRIQIQKKVHKLMANAVNVYGTTFSDIMDGWREVLCKSNCFSPNTIHLLGQRMDLWDQYGSAEFVAHTNEVLYHTMVQMWPYSQNSYTINMDSRMMFYRQTVFNIKALPRTVFKFHYDVISLAYAKKLRTDDDTAAVSAVSRVHPFSTTAMDNFIASAAFFGQYVAMPGGHPLLDSRIAPSGSVVTGYAKLVLDTMDTPAATASTSVAASHGSGKLDHRLHWEMLLLSAINAKMGHEWTIHITTVIEYVKNSLISATATEQQLKPTYPFHPASLQASFNAFLLLLQATNQELQTVTSPEPTNNAMQPRNLSLNDQLSMNSSLAIYYSHQYDVGGKRAQHCIRNLVDHMAPFCPYTEALVYGPLVMPSQEMHLDVEI